MNNFTAKANFLWSIADLLRGHYKQADYGTVILPFTVLLRLDQVLEPTKAAVLEDYERFKTRTPDVLEFLLSNRTRLKFQTEANSTLQNW